MAGAGSLESIHAATMYHRGETSPEWATPSLEIRQYEKTETRDLTRANGYIQRLKDVWSK